MRKLNVCLTLCLLLFAVPMVKAQSASHIDGLPSGVVIPPTGTVFALETPSSLVQIHPTEVVSNSHAAGNFARSMVYVGGHASVELDGTSSSTNLAEGHDSFLIRIGGDDPDLVRQRVHLVRLRATKDRRVVISYSQNIFGGQRKKKVDDIQIKKSDAAKDTWLKITPQKPLAPGEYGILFMNNDPAFVPDVVYDFEVGSDSATPGKS
ncbi:MAG: hypothetical protein ABI177_07120 [Edaphobacter sp.]